MAKFCTTCGTPTDETGVCPKCAAAPAAAPAAPTAENQYVAATKVAVKETIPFAKSYWKTPMEATKEVLAHKNTPLAAVLMIIYALANILLVHIIFSKFAGAIAVAVAIYIVLFAGGKMYGNVFESIETNEGTVGELYEEITEGDWMDIASEVIDMIDYFEYYS